MRAAMAQRLPRYHRKSERTELGTVLNGMFNLPSSCQLYTGTALSKLLSIILPDRSVCLYRAQGASKAARLPAVFTLQSFSIS